MKPRKLTPPNPSKAENTGINIKTTLGNAKLFLNGQRNASFELYEIFLFDLHIQKGPLLLSISLPNFKSQPKDPGELGPVKKHLSLNSSRATLSNCHQAR
jgi:hypothetical protein